MGKFLLEQHNPLTYDSMDKHDVIITVCSTVPEKEGSYHVQYAE